MGRCLLIGAGDQTTADSEGCVSPLLEEKPYAWAAQTTLSVESMLQGQSEGLSPRFRLRLIAQARRFAITRGTSGASDSPLSRGPNEGISATARADTGVRR